MGGATLLEGGEARDGVDIFPVEDVDAVEAENVLCGGRRRGSCGHCARLLLLNQERQVDGRVRLGMRRRDEKAHKEVIVGRSSSVCEGVRVSRQW